MNYKLPTLPLAISLGVLFCIATFCSSQVTGNKEVAKLAPDRSSDCGGAAARGQNLVARAAKRLLVAPGLEVKTRQSVRMFGQKLVGSGNYCQLTNGPKLFLKLDLKLHVGDQVRSLRQISDGDSLWEIRAQRDSHTFSHVNLGRLREVASQTDPMVPPSYWMALGGLPRMMAKLEEMFSFETPQEATIGDHPVWRVEGAWKRSMLAKMLPGQGDAILAGDPVNLAKLPEQLPHGVTLVLGRDQVVPLFPYRFSFYRNVDNQENGEVERVAMVTWELFELRVRPELRPRDFDFRPAADQEFQELTDNHVDRLKQASEKLADH